MLFILVWDIECVPSYMEESSNSYFFKKEDRKDLGNYKGITVLNVIGN